MLQGSMQFLLLLSVISWELRGLEEASSLTVVSSDSWQPDVERKRIPNNAKADEVQ